jgi:cell surface protein SprA
LIFPKTNKLKLFLCVILCVLAWKGTARENSLFNLGVFQDSVRNDSTENSLKYKKTARPTYQPKDRYGDEFSNRPGKSSPLEMSKSKNVKTKVTIDESGQYYRVDEKIKGVDYRPPTTMTYEQYKKYQNKRATQNFFRSKSKAEDEKDATLNEKSRGLVPRVYMSPALDRIFGGNYIDMKLNGSVLLDLGYRIQSTDNPSIPVNQRTTGGLFFDQTISMNAQAKIGERLKININQDTKSQFSFDNNFKLEYSSLETDILQKVEVGRISMPINSSLIKGVQNLFGVKATMKFGRLQVVSAIGNQQGSTNDINVSGGALSRNIQVRADNYEDNKHYFLGQFFRDNYEKSLSTLPQITSGVFITRVEVWITNRTLVTDGSRIVSAFMDLGEHNPHNQSSILPSYDRTASNNANTLFYNLTAAGIRNADQVTNAYSLPPVNLQNGNDFELIRNARKLSPSEYRYHPQLGYISLNAPLGRDDIMGVAYEYSYNGQIYRVGELNENYASRPNTEVLMVKLLRPSTIRTDVPMWNLQMKNIYYLGTSGISRENFQLRITYRDDITQLYNPVITNNPKSNLDGRPLVQIMQLDRLNQSNDYQPDGNFDFVDAPTNSAIQTSNPIYNQNTQSTNGTNPINSTNQIQNSNAGNIIQAVTIDPAYGRVIFPVLEPFGKTLKQAFGTDSINNPQIVNKYVYEQLYSGTKSDALQLSNKNKFFITGQAQSTASDEIPLQTFGTLATGSVSVTAGSTKLIENQDFTVDYNLGKVKIINPAYLLPGQNLKVSVDKTDLFQIRTKTFFGTRLDYIVNKDIAIGGTLLSLTERPLVSRVAIGDEPLSNMVVGIDGTYRTDSRLLTTLIDKLPVIQTKEKSTIQINGEIAKLFSGTPALTNKDGAGGTFYIDDFENASIPFRLDNSPATNWHLAATPPGLEGSSSPTNPYYINDRKAKLAWYNVDPIFYRNTNPGNISNVDMTNNYVRAVSTQAIFPGRDRTQVQLNEPIFDLAYYPSERGPYNFNTNLTSNGLLPNPQKNWAGITRAVNNYDTDFDNANYQYLEFWMMDPFLQGQNGVIQDGIFNKNNNTGGKLLFHLGSVSEDVVKDSKMNFEQGLPASGIKDVTVTKTNWGYATNQQYVTNAFNNDPNSRPNQDVGLDGLSNNDEQGFFQTYLSTLNTKGVTNPLIQTDPAGDDFKHFLGSDQDAAGKKVLERYKNYNGIENNSPINNGSSATVASNYTTPDNEDLNQNNTLNDIEAYFQYEIDLAPGGLAIGQNHIVNTVAEQILDVNGNPTGQSVNWYLFRIPIRENYTTYGNISNFKSIRFLRTVLTGWKDPVVLRMAQFQLVSSQWRPFTGDLTNKSLQNIIEPDDQVLSISTVNVEENAQSNSPNVSPYVVPPGFNRDLDVNSTNIRRLNEHSLRLRVENLKDGDARAVFKNTGGLSLINYEAVKMFVHAEADPNLTKDDETTIFIRFGSDFTDNYYEIEKPLKLTQTYNGFQTSEQAIWRIENTFNIILDSLSELKLRRDREQTGDYYSIYRYQTDPNNIYSIRGNPTYNNIQTIMIGIRNPKSPDRQPKNITIWADELRVAGIKNEAGWAATGRINVKLADLGNVSGTFKYSAAGFGGIEQKISQRSQENNLQIGANTNLQLDKLIPFNKKIGLKLPVYASIEKQVVSPLYDPLNTDVKLNRSVENKDLIQQKIDPVSRQTSNYASLVEDITVRRSVSFTNIQKTKVKPGAKKHIYDIENISVTLGYSDIVRSNTNLAQYDSRNYKAGVSYNYAPRSPNIEPFKNVTFLKNPYFKLISDLNLVIFPNSFSVRGDLDRTITKTQYSNGFSLYATGNGNFAYGRDTIGVPVNYEKRFLFNRSFAVGWTITKSITFNYNASVNAIVDEPAGGFDGYAPIRPGFTKSDSVMKNLLNGGRIKTFNQQYGINYRLPIDKLPITNWLNAEARYSAGYNWNAGPARNPDTLKLGNTAQNNRDISLNLRGDLTTFYNKIAYLKKINTPAPVSFSNTKRLNLPAIKDTVKKPREFKILKASLRTMMLVRSFSATYQRTESTILPGYLGTPKYLGVSLNENGAPDWSFLPFILGSQNANNFQSTDFANKYMSPNKNLSNPISQNQTENYSGKATLEPFKDFRITLDARISNSLSYTEIFKFDSASGGFISQTPRRSGNYSLTNIAIGTFFGDEGDNNTSLNFNQFVNNRSVFQQRFTEANPLKSNVGIYTQNSQDVLIASFLSAYQGSDVNSSKLSSFPKIPLPNWRVDYAGLPSIIPALKKILPSISITHAYSSSYSVNSYSTSPQYYKGDTVRLVNFWNDNLYPTVTDSGRFVPINIVNTVSIIDRFTPFLGITVKTKSNMSIRGEVSTDRSVTLNVTNRQITESRNHSITIGYGYTKSNLRLPFRYEGREIVLKNDVTFRVDITRRESTTFLRKIDDFSTTITQGNVSFQIRPNMAYSVNQRLTTQLYFEYTLNAPKVSNSFARTTFAFGVQFRYSLS